MFLATLDGIFKYSDLPEEYEPYVQFKATIEKRELKQSDEIAILNIAGTSTHHVLFLDSYQNISEIENELKEADAKINHTTLKIIGGHLWVYLPNRIG